MNMEQPFVELVVTTMQMMSFGFAVIYVRDGSMENVSKLHLPKQSILITTNAHPAAPKGLVFSLSFTNIYI